MLPRAINGSKLFGDLWGHILGLGNVWGSQNPTISLENVWGAETAFAAPPLSPASVENQRSFPESDDHQISSPKGISFWQKGWGRGVEGGGRC